MKHFNWQIFFQLSLLQVDHPGFWGGLTCLLAVVWPCSSLVLYVGCMVWWYVLLYLGRGSAPLLHWLHCSIIHLRRYGQPSGSPGHNAHHWTTCSLSTHWVWVWPPPLDTIYSKLWQHFWTESFPPVSWKSRKMLLLVELLSWSSDLVWIRWIKLTVKPPSLFV